MRSAVRAAGVLGVVLLAACGGKAAPASSAAVDPAPVTVLERMIAMLPQGAQVVIEVDLARLRANPVIGDVVTRGLAERAADLPAGVPASPVAEAEQLVLAAYGVGTAQAATLTVLAAPHDLAGTTKLVDGFYAVGPPEWLDQLQARVALSTTGEASFALRAPPELLALRRRAMPEGAPGASLRVTARLPFDARVALARQTGLDTAPAQISAWADVVDDVALIVDCDADDPGNKAADAKRGSDAARRLEATLRGALAGVAEQPAVRLLGLPASLDNAKFVARGSWVRLIVAIGPQRLKRVVERASTLLGPPSPSKAAPSPASAPVIEPPAAPTQPRAAAPRGEPS